MFAIVLWIYIGLLLVGGTVGFLKARSSVSLITSLVSAAILALCAVGFIQPAYVAVILVGVLLAVFVVRYAKSRRLMPSGLMAGVSAIVFVLLLIARMALD